MISAADQERIAFAQELLDSGKYHTDRFDSPRFLTCAIKHGLLKGTAPLEDAYTLFGKLVRSDLLRKPQHERGIVWAIEALSTADLLKLRESLAGVIPFPGKK